MDKKKFNEAIQVAIRIVITEVFLRDWESNNGEGIKAHLRIIKAEIENHPKYKKLERYWPREDKKEELDSLVNEIAGDYYCKSKEWIKNPKIETYPDTHFIIEGKISELLSEEKLKDRYEWEGERRKEKLEKERGKNFLEETSFVPSTIPPPSLEDRKVNETIEILIQTQLKPLKDLYEKIKMLNDKKVVRLIKDDFYRHDRNNLKELLDNILKAKSVYQLAKEKKADFRKLLYTLKTIGFPLLEKSRGRGFYIITYNALPFFEEVFSMIKIMWEMEENYKKWQEFFKKEYGWEKSRVTNFMKRRIQNKVVPPCFFDIFPPDCFSTQHISNFIIHRSKQIMKMFELFEKITKKRLAVDFTHDKIKRELQKICSSQI
ncbi:MAG: hypothetical protein NC818_05695 [Candidatus Omnitrophica bacterium]|nr:hypothetical protein [Candidatus Omnitrophota bacterium]